MVICLKVDVKLERDGHERESCHPDVMGALCIAQPPGSAWITHHLQPEFLLGNHRTLRYIEYVLVIYNKGPFPHLAAPSIQRTMLFLSEVS